MKKSKFLTFVFSMIPGLGQLYQGLKKRGVSMLICFFGLIAFCTAFNFDALSFLLPVIWFYSFFDAINRWSLTVEQLEQVEDKSIIPLNISEDQTLMAFFKNKHKIIGIAVILLGVMLIYNMFVSDISYVLSSIFPNIDFGSVLNDIPKLIISILIILLGIKMIKGSDKVEK